MNKARNARGFTLIEILVVIAILAVLSALAVIVYRYYVDRARAAEIVEKFDAVRTTVNVSLTQGTKQCADILKPFDGKTLDDPYARLSIDLVAVQGGPAAGWRPVMVVCARADRHGPTGVSVAREAHNIFSKNRQIESGAVLTESVVSFAVPLSQGAGSQCAVPFGNRLDACGDPVAVPTAATINTPGQAPTQAIATPTPQTVQAPSVVPAKPADTQTQATTSDGCPTGKESYTYTPAQGAAVRTCVDKCGAGQIRDPNNFRWCAPAPSQAIVAKPADTQTQAATSDGCPPGKESYTYTAAQGATVRTCVDKCGPGQVRDPNNFRWCAPAPASACRARCDDKFPNRHPPGQWQNCTKAC